MTHTSPPQPLNPPVTSPAPPTATRRTPPTPLADEPISEEFREQITATLTAFISQRQLALAALGDDLDPLFVTASHYLTGGKRLRPAFAYWGWRSAGGKPDKTDAIVSAAAAIELVHASALVHDDVMDDSATRRGRPAAHHEFASRRAERLGVEPTDPIVRRYGRSAAILLGDMLLSWSDQLLMTSGFKPKAVARGRVYFDKLRTEVVAGQFLDVLAQTSSTSSSSDAMRIVRYKSAKYTVERPLQFGAVLAKADLPLLTALSSYGVPLGEAFQLRDDLLGVLGESIQTGKPSGDDIREGKRTLLIARAHQLATPAQRDVLSANFANPQISTEGVASVQEVLRATGAVKAVETVITELTAAALAALAHAPISDEAARSALRVLSDRVTNRTV